MTDNDLKVALLQYIRARKQDTSVFYDHGSVRNTALLVAGLSIGRVYEFESIECTWDRHYAVARFLEHFDSAPGSLCGCLITGTLREETPGSVRYKDIRKAATLIRNASVPKLLEELEQWQLDPTVKVSAVLSNILIAHDCADLASVIDSLDDISRSLLRMKPFKQNNDTMVNTMLKRNETFEHAHPVLRAIHAELIEAYSNLYHRE
jgi:hypothetical protein